MALTPGLRLSFIVPFSNEYRLPDCTGTKGYPADFRSPPDLPVVTLPG